MPKSVRWLTVVLALCGALLSFTAGGAAGAGLSPVVVDCNAHSKLTRHYSIAQLQYALGHIPQDINEYSDCHDVIEHQLLAQLRGVTRPGAGSGSGAGGPSASGGAGSFLPGWLIAVLVVLVLAAASFVGLELRRRRRP